MSTPGLQAILHVDDDGQVRGQVRSVLESAGFTVFDASSGREALQLVQEREFALVLTDLQMPEMDGLTLIEQLHRVQPGLPIVAVAEPSSAREVLQALEVEVRGYIAKPVSDAQLVALVNDVLEERDSHGGIRVISATEHWLELSFPSQTAYISRVREFIENLETGIESSERSSLLYAFAELAQNAIEHGNRLDPDTRVTLGWYRFPGLRVFRLRDEGVGFDPRAISHAVGFDESVDPRDIMRLRKERGIRPGGLGIASAARFASELIYNERGNELIMFKQVTESETQRD